MAGEHGCSLAGAGRLLTSVEFLDDWANTVGDTAHTETTAALANLLADAVLFGELPPTRLRHRLDELDAAGSLASLLRRLLSKTKVVEG